MQTACSMSRLLQPKDVLHTTSEGSSGSQQLMAMRRLVSLASNAALAAASAVSSSSILQTPSVLAAKYWPEFHNGVAAGLMVSPHASVGLAHDRSFFFSYGTTKKVVQFH